MLRYLYLLQNSGLCLFTWKNPVESDHNTPDTDNVTALITALRIFSRETLQKAMQAVDLDDGGYLMIIEREKVYAIGMFSNGDGKWRAKVLLKQIAMEFSRLYLDNIREEAVNTATFKPFLGKIPQVLRYTTRIRTPRRMTLGLGFSLVMLSILLMILGIYTRTNDLLSFFIGNDIFQLIPFILALGGVSLACGAFIGATSTRFSILSAILFGLAQYALGIVLWPMTAIFMRNLLTSVVVAAFTVGSSIDRQVFLGKVD